MVKLRYDADRGSFRVDAEDGEELTEQQATAIAVRDLASALSFVGDQLGDISRDIASLPRG